MWGEWGGNHGPPPQSSTVTDGRVTGPAICTRCPLPASGAALSHREAWRWLALVLGLGFNQVPALPLLSRSWRVNTRDPALLICGFSRTPGTEGVLSQALGTAQGSALTELALWCPYSWVLVQPYKRHGLESPCLVSAQPSHDLYHGHKPPVKAKTMKTPPSKLDGV